MDSTPTTPLAVYLKSGMVGGNSFPVTCWRWLIPGPALSSSVGLGSGGRGQKGFHSRRCWSMPTQWPEWITLHLFQSGRRRSISCCHSWCTGCSFERSWPKAPFRLLSGLHLFRSGNCCGHPHLGGLSTFRLWLCQSLCQAMEEGVLGDAFGLLRSGVSHAPHRPFAVSH